MAKTSGFEWLEHSLISFNGSGYADTTSGKAFLESYIAYKRWKKKPEAARLAERLYASALNVTNFLVENSDGAGRIPSPASYNKFVEYYKSTQGIEGRMVCKDCGVPVNAPIKGELNGKSLPPVAPAKLNYCFDCKVKHWKGEHVKID